MMKGPNHGTRHLTPQAKVIDLQSCENGFCNADNPTADEHPELLSPQSTDTPSMANTPLELEGDINLGISPPVDIYTKPVADPAWYEIQEQDGPLLLPDAFGCTDPSGGFVGDDWLKVNTRALCSI